MRSGKVSLVRRIINDTFHVFVESHAYFAAAALAYFALLSLVPFFILAASVIGFMFADDGSGEAYGVVAGNLERFLPFLRGELELRLRELVEARNITGLVGFGSLLVTAALFFFTIEQAFSAIFPKSAVRGFWRSKGLAVALLPIVVGLLGFLHYAFLVVNTVVGSLGIPVVERLVVSPVINQVISTAILGIEFCLVVYWFERGSIPFHSIAIGAAVFSFLWFAARVAFTFYVQRIAAFSIIYGSLGALVVLVLWVYYAALVFLVGCSVTESVRRSEEA